MKSKIIALTKNLDRILDKLEKKENALALLLKLSHNTSPTPVTLNDNLRGLLINPTTLTNKGRTHLIEELETDLRLIYSQNPLTYIRLSINIPMLQRIMALESATTLNLIANASQKKSLYFALSSKLSAFRSNIDNFIKQLRDDYKLNIIPDALEGLWAEFKKPTP